MFYGGKTVIVSFTSTLSRLFSSLTFLNLSLFSRSLIWFHNVLQPLSFSVKPSIININHHFRFFPFFLFSCHLGLSGLFNPFSITVLKSPWPSLHQPKQFHFIYQFWVSKGTQMKQRASLDSGLWKPEEQQHGSICVCLQCFSWKTTNQATNQTEHYPWKADLSASWINRYL